MKNALVGLVSALIMASNTLFADYRDDVAALVVRVAELSGEETGLGDACTGLQPVEDRQPQAELAANIVEGRRLV